MQATYSRFVMALPCAQYHQLKLCSGLVIQTKITYDATVIGMLLSSSITCDQMQQSPDSLKPNCVHPQLNKERLNVEQ